MIHKAALYLIAPSILSGALTFAGIQSVPAETYTANDWLLESISEDSETRDQAEGYVFGVLAGSDAVTHASKGLLIKHFCLESDLTPEDMARDIRAAIIRDSSLRKAPANVGLLLAAKDAYPCTPGRDFE